MNKKVTLLIIAILATPILLMGCGSQAPATPTNDPALIYTAAAQTADARLTQIFQSTPSVTPIPPSPTFDPLVATQAAQTVSARQTQTAGVTLTPQVTATSTPAPTGIFGDMAAFVDDVTIPDDTVIAPGAAFTKTWKLQNAGISTWTTAYTLVFISGQQMGPVVTVPLAQSVSPGQQIDISVDLVAPTTNGSYTGYWKMKNASGQFFNDPVYVRITVGAGGATPTPTGTPGATPTATGLPSNPITSLTMSVNPASATQCPFEFTFTAQVTMNQSATITYNLEAGSDSGFEFDLPDPASGTYDIGTATIEYKLTFTNAGSGWVSFHVTSPVDMTSNQAFFSLTCSR
jgi:hypothetical protein